MPGSRPPIRTRLDWKGCRSFFQNRTVRWITQSIACTEQMLPQKEVLTLSISQPLVRHVSRAWVEPVDTVRKPSSQPEPEKEI